MTYETPRANSDKLCHWCGSAIRQSGIGRSRDYCRRTCRELAYRERKTQKRIAEAVAAAAVSSTDVGQPADSSVDETEGRPSVPAPAAPPRRPAPVPAVSRRRVGMTADPMPLWPEPGDEG